MRLAFDIETDGFLEELTKIHCIHTVDLDSGESRGFIPDTIEDGIRYLQQATELIGHNIIKFDIPAIEKVTGVDFSRIKQTDTLNLSRLVFPQISDQFDWPLIRHQQKTGQKEFPKNLIGKHSLKAWGYRLHEYKGDFEGPWDTWTQEMDDYCAQDVIVTEMIYNRLMKEEPSPQSVWIEMEFQKVIHKMEQHGIHFDLELAHRLYAELAEKKQEAFSELSRVFPPIYISKGEFTPKRNNKTKGYTEGVPFTKIELQEFNPGSDDQIVNRFIRKYKWEPEVFSKKTGKPTASDDVLKTLDYYEVPYLQQFRMVSKRLSILDGWLKATTKEGKIHGGLITNGAVTGRGTHKVIANVPRVSTPYGKEFRALFMAGEGFSLIGCDAAGLELRFLAHYMAAWDKGKYVESVLGDPHTDNQIAAGLPTRDNAKTFIYGFL